MTLDSVMILINEVDIAGIHQHNFVMFEDTMDVYSRV